MMALLRFVEENYTLIIAVYGASLATCKFVYDYWKGRREIRVKLNYSREKTMYDDEVGPEILAISAVNTGYRSVILDGAGYILPDKTCVHFDDPLRLSRMNVKFPKTLSEGQRCNVWIELKDLGQQLRERGLSGKVKLRGYYRSTVGKTYRSKPKEFTIPS